MKIVLIFPPFLLDSIYNLSPLGLINIATMLKHTTHETVILDFVLMLRQHIINPGQDIYQKCAEIILKECPDIIGFSAQCTTYPSVIQISKKIKEINPKPHIVIGGHNASFVDKSTLLEFPFIDAIVRGEGEITFKELVNAYNGNQDIKNVAGVTYRDKNNIIRNQDRNLINDLDTIPPPDYTMTPPFSEYRDACNLPRSIAIIEAGRGCPHSCVYCSESAFWRRTPRQFSVKRLIHEMQNLRDNFHAECFLLSYDQFTSNKKFVKDFCNAVIDTGLNNIPWYCISRLDTVDSALLRLMKNSGCESMCYGIDSGSEKTLAFIHKNIDKNLLLQRVKETTENGIVPTLSFVIGFPKEEQEDIDETLSLALMSGIHGNVNPLIQMPTVLPGTELWKIYGQSLVRKTDTYFSLGIEFNNGKRFKDDEVLIQNNPLIFSSFYNLLCKGVNLDDLNLISSYFPIIINLYPKSFLLLSSSLKKSISALFIEWMSWLNSRMKRDKPYLTPQDCYKYFTDFAVKFSERKDIIFYKHLRDILKYETLGIKAGKFNVKPYFLNIDINDTDSFMPVKNHGIIIAEFDFNIPVIISNLKNNIIKDEYPQTKTLLIFKHSGEELNVTEINDFGVDFLNMCDGKRSLSKITNLLYQHYGLNIKQDVFLNSCIETARVLGESGCLEQKQTD